MGNNETGKLIPMTITELKQAMRGEVVELPPFPNGTKFIARLSRPSLLELVRRGNLPNSLMEYCRRMFEGEGLSDESIRVPFNELMDVFEALCSACFVEPTYNEIKNAGITMTDQQLLFIFNYSQIGIEEVKPSIPSE